MSNAQTATKLMTAEEFFEWCQRPENEARHFELDRGEVVEMCRPGERHGFVCGRVSFFLNLYAMQRNKGYALTNDSGAILERDPDTVKGPDIVFFDQTKPYAELNPKMMENVPTLAVEILSPNDRLRKVLARAQQFLRSGIRMVWLVDPEACDITVLRAGTESQGFEKHQELICEDVLPGFRCRVSDIFLVPGEVSPAPASQPAS